jgi:hypothetical protein
MILGFNIAITIAGIRPTPINSKKIPNTTKKITK